MARPLEELQVTARQIPAYKEIPNTSLQSRPLLIYHSALNTTSPEDAITYLESVGAVVPEWTYSMYPSSHFHSTTHEVLVVVSGKANLCFGHEENPNRFETIVTRGDVIIVPAGVSHCLLEDLDGTFTMVGAYPAGKQWDMCYGEETMGETATRIRKVGWFEKDPIYGDGGPTFNV